jgi:hypothetical protein
VNEVELALSQTLGTLAESSAVLAAFVGLVGICRLHVLLDRRRDAEGELRAWMKRLTKQDTFVLPLNAVLAMVDEERTRAEGYPQSVGNFSTLRHPPAAGRAPSAGPLTVT